MKASKMTRSRFFVPLLLALAALLVPATALADASPQAFVKAQHEQLTALLKKPKSAATEKKIQSIFDTLLDYHSLAKQSLGEYWDQRKASEQKDFENVLQRLVRNAYRKNLRKTLDYKIDYNGEDKAKEGYLVKTVAKSKTNAREDPVHIDYVLHKVDGKWRVYDIVTEGSSLVNNYRSQFRRIIKKKGFDELMRRMKKKLDKEEAS